MKINRDTQLCISLASRPGNFGNAFHNYLYRKYHLNFLYKSLSTDNLEQALGGVRALGIKGCSLSMPFKKKALGLVDSYDEDVRKIGAINTIVNQDDKLKGFNTDYLSVLTTLKKYSLNPESPTLLYGAGGMASAIAMALSKLGFNNVFVLARSREKTETFAQKFGFSTLEGGVPSIDYLINATPVGMIPSDQECPFVDEMILKSKLVVDVIIQPAETVLLKKAKHRNKKIIDGLEITMGQAMEQFFLYTGHHLTLEDAQEGLDYYRSYV